MLATFHLRMFYLPRCYKRNIDKKHKIVSVSDVLYACETDGRTQIYSANSVLRRVFGSVGEEVLRDEIITYCTGS